MTSETAEVVAPSAELPYESFGTRLWENIKGGNLGSAPVIVGLTIIVIVFALTAQNFFTAVNFNNIITQMAGTTMLAFGVVFVLLLGEIDLSIAYLSGIAGLVAAELQKPDSGHFLPGIWPILIALLVAAALGIFQGSFVALIGVPAFVVTLAGLLAWQGVIQVGLGPGGPIIIQNRWINYTESYFFSSTAGWLIAILLSLLYVGGIAASVINKRRHGVAIRYPYVVAAKLIAVPAAAFLIVAICNHDRGVPLAGLEIIAFLLFWTFIAQRTTFGRHVYAVGGNAEAARRAGISVPRIRILVFMISGLMAGVGGILLAANVRSVAPSQGGGTLLLDAISAAVIGGTSLFGGRGNIRSAVLGAAVIATIANGLFIFAFSPG
ncbi:MAG: D-xylose transport system permease protein, partial [Gaiellaceae bacterium]|nr:D-xylose transport system permease protein [Gaiellaceae bacterium]